MKKLIILYSDKFAINVLNLSKAALAADEDRQWKLDYRVRLFKATTWEDSEKRNTNAHSKGCFAKNF